MKQINKFWKFFISNHSTKLFQCCRFFLLFFFPFHRLAIFWRHLPKHKHMSTYKAVKTQKFSEVTLKKLFPLYKTTSYEFQCKTKYFHKAQYSWGWASNLPACLPPNFTHVDNRKADFASFPFPYDWAICFLQLAQFYQTAPDLLEAQR